MARITRTTPAIGSVAVTLVSSELRKIFAPSLVTIPDNATFQEFSITAPNDDVYEADLSLALVAQAVGFANDSVLITVRDDDPSLTVLVNIVDVVLSDSDNSSSVTFEFSDDVAGFDAADVTVSGGTLSPLTMLDGNSFTATFTAALFVRRAPLGNVTITESLVFRATFSESVSAVDAADFVVNGVTTATVSSVIAVIGSNGTQYDVTVSGGALAGLTGSVGLNVATTRNIVDLAGNLLPLAELLTVESYALDNAVPTAMSFRLMVPTSNTTNANVLIFRAAFTRVGGVAVNVLAGSGKDSVIGSAFGDSIRGSSGNDLVDGVAGDTDADRLSGAGNGSVLSAGDQVLADALDAIDTVCAFDFAALLT